MVPVSPTFRKNQAIFSKNLPHPHFFASRLAGVASNSSNGTTANGWFTIRRGAGNVAEHTC
jgi:hypothetical protein